MQPAPPPGSPVWPKGTPEPLIATIVEAVTEVHRELGPGLLESAYEGCLSFELALRGLPFRKQQRLPVAYKGYRIDCGYRLDMVVADRVLIEVKAVQALLPIHDAQVLTYLKLTGLTEALLINFNVARIRDGIRRIGLA